MHGFGGNNQTAYQDGIYALPMRVKASATNMKVNVTTEGMVRLGDGKDLYEHTALATDYDVLDLDGNPVLVGKHVFYVHHTDAKDANDAALPRFGCVPEAKGSRVAPNGSKAELPGRSLPLAELTVSAHTGTVTFANVWAPADTATITVDGTAVVATLIAGDDTPEEAAERAKLALEANATVAGKVTVTRAGAVLTIASRNGINYSLVAAEVTAGSGTATASGANLSGGGITAVDNTYRFKGHNPPRTYGQIR